MEMSHDRRFEPSFSDGYDRSALEQGVLQQVGCGRRPGDRAEVAPHRGAVLLDQRGERRQCHVSMNDADAGFVRSGEVKPRYAVKAP